MMISPKRIATAREMGISARTRNIMPPAGPGNAAGPHQRAGEQPQPGIIVDRSSLPTDVIVFGALVKVKDLEMSEIEIYQLVGPGEKITPATRSPNSPIGQGLLARRSARSSHPGADGTIRYESWKLLLGVSGEC